MKVKLNLPQSLSPLYEKEFRIFITTRFLFIMALRMMGALVGYWMYELTNNPLAIGLIGLSEVVPAVLSWENSPARCWTRSQVVEFLCQHACLLLEVPTLLRPQTRASVGTKLCAY